MLQCVAVCCSVLQCVAVCCSVLQCVVVCCSVLKCVAVCCSVLQCAAVCCSVLQCVAVRRSVFVTTIWSDMGWLRLVGSLKLQVSFAKEPYKRDDILQKRPIILRSLLIVAPPHIRLHSELTCNSVLQCVAVCFSVLQCVAVCSSVFAIVI